MPRFHPTVSRVLTFAMLVTSALADTVTLKSGEHLEGKIIKETENDVTMEVQVAAGITDERVVPRSNIDKIDKLTPELAAFQALAKVQLGTNSLTEAQYDAAITALQAYVTQYPDSSRLGDVQATLKAFQEEKKRAESGEVKIDGQWLSKAEAAKESVQIHGRLALAYMKSESTAGDIIGALNTFVALEKNYPGSAVMPEAIDLAVQLATALKNSVDQEIPIQKVLKAEHDKSVAAADPIQKAEILAAAKRKEDLVNATAQAAEHAGRWPAYIKDNEASMTLLQTHATRELTRLSALPVDKMRQSLQFTEDARQTLAAGDITAASDTLKQATQLWPVNDLAVRLGKEIDAKKAEARPVTTPVPAAAPRSTPKQPATPRPSAAVQAAPAVAATTAGDDDKPFIMTLPGAISVVVGIAVVLVGVNVFLKMKKRKAAEQVE